MQSAVLTSRARIVIVWAGVLTLASVVVSSPRAPLYRPDKPAVIRDAFRDGSGRTGPALAAVPGGAAMLGGRPSEPAYTLVERAHHVELTAFAIGAYEVTNAEFAEFLNEKGNGPIDGQPPLVSGPASRITERNGRFVPLEGAERRPVVSVSWQGALAYCRWLSARTGRTYRLPSGAQWEAAARGGTTTTWWWGDADVPSRYRSRTDATADVGSYPANPFGVYDTSGNVWEWTNDCFDPNAMLYAPTRDPSRFDPECMTPEIRGGSFRDRGDRTRPGHRASSWWWGRFDHIGFRVARLDAPSVGAHR